MSHHLRNYRGCTRVSTESSGVVRNGDEKETKDNKIKEPKEERGGVIKESCSPLVLLDILEGTQESARTI